MLVTSQQSVLNNGVTYLYLMPVKECPNGKFRIGEGKCVFDTKEKAESAYKGYLASRGENENNEK